MIGFIKLQRDILEWEWYQHPIVSRVYFHLLLRANFKDKPWQGRQVKRGQLITSHQNLAYELRLSIQQIRTALDKLQSSGHILIKSTNKYSLITIVNYEVSQSSDSLVNKPANNPSTSKKQSSNKQITTTKERKNNNKKKIEERKLDFKNQVFKHSHYSNSILNDFFNYWAEIDKKTNTMKFEKQSAFEIEIRLKSWKKKEQEWGNKKVRKTPISTNR